jgi:type III pantothenate kinase
MNAGSAETWLFDLGNSRAKAARLVNREPVDVTAMDWDKQDFVAALRGELENWPRAKRVWVASVASAERMQRVREVLASIESGPIEWLRTPRRAGGVTNDYAKPERLGIDRFLAMLAAHAHGPDACVVVGCGTALTLDAVTGDGHHAEGMIALSPPGMLQALQARTAIADVNPDAFADRAGDDTANALQKGCWASAGALVEWFATCCRTRFGAQRVWLHGGWAERLAEWLANDGFRAEILEHAVLQGLATWVGDTGIKSDVGDR